MDEGTTDRLIFELGGRRLAVNLGDVLGIINAERFYHVPGQSDPVEGMVSRRGEVVAVANIRKYLGMDGGGNEEKNKVIIVKDGKKTLGLLIGDSDVIFKWEGSAKNEGDSPEEEKPFEFLDWSPIYDVVTSALTFREEDENTHS